MYATLTQTCKEVDDSKPIFKSNQWCEQGLFRSETQIEGYSRGILFELSHKIKSGEE